MDRLNGPARIMIVSDLDNTMVDYHDIENISLYRFNSFWEAHYRHDCLLIFFTGRASPALYDQMRKEKPLLTPDITVMTMATEIGYGYSMKPDNKWVESLNHKWDRNIVMEEASQYPELTIMAEAEQRPHKVSFYCPIKKMKKVKRELTSRLENRGVEVKMINRIGWLILDIIPIGASRAKVLAYILEKFIAAEKLPEKILASGEDAELFSFPDSYGVMVSNAPESLVKWHAENAKDNEKIIHATERGAAGIIQAFGRFEIGPATSPRDFTDFMDPLTENNFLHRMPEGCHAGHLIVKFYLFYERWRRGEIQNIDSNITSLKTCCDPTAVSVDPSGAEKTFFNRIDELKPLYGDMEGRKFRVWVDQISFTQPDPTTWLATFYKWEQYGNERFCSSNTAKIIEKLYPKEVYEGQEPPEQEEFDPGVAWMHLKQTWVEGLENLDPLGMVF